MSKENLTYRQAIDKLKEIVSKNKVCLFATNLEKLPIESRPMMVQECDDEGNLWFISGKDSHKNIDIQRNNRVQLFFTNSFDSEYLSIYGHAFIYDDKQIIEAKWSEGVRKWLKSKDNPNVSVIRVAPLNSYYWDIKGEHISSMLSFAWAIIVGKKKRQDFDDDEIEGEIKL